MILPIKLALVAAPLAAGYFLWWKPKHASVALPPASHAFVPPSSQPSAPASAPAPSYVPQGGASVPGGWNPAISDQPVYQDPAADPGSSGGGIADYAPGAPVEEPSDPGILADLSNLGYDINPFASVSGVTAQGGRIRHIGDAPSVQLLRAMARRRHTKRVLG